ncbi:MAG: sigma-70 family RNA polymerase sigma factor, partial [Prevotellaceae bacterium]|jgi:RNA polymerase sigma-70 factor (ECF subfamily)|nr:sigma-70 family RNA polymerase sigma factor [Prevotellaceae bacterium]
VQRTFIKVWEVRQNIDSEKSFFSFLCTIAKNMLINDLERKTIEFIYKEYYRLNLDSRHENADNQLNINILQEIIDNLAEKLPPGRKKVFGLFQKNELSVREIAAKLGLSESAVRTQLTKALDFMRENIKKYYLVLYFLLYVNFS